MERLRKIAGTSVKITGVLTIRAQLGFLYWHCQPSFCQLDISCCLYKPTSISLVRSYGRSLLRADGNERIRSGTIKCDIFDVRMTEMLKVSLCIQNMHGTDITKTDDEAREVPMSAIFLLQTHSILTSVGRRVIAIFSWHLAFLVCSFPLHTHTSGIHNSTTKFFFGLILTNAWQWDPRFSRL